MGRMNSYKIEPLEGHQPIRSGAEFNEVTQSAIIIHRTINSDNFQRKLRGIVLTLIAYIGSFIAGCMPAKVSLQETALNCVSSNLTENR